VSVLRVQTSEGAVEHVLACARAATLSEEEAGVRAEEPAAAVEEVAAVLSAMWGVPIHDVDFLLANTSLPALSRIGSDAEFGALIAATEGLGIEPGLVEGAIRWLQEDALAT
jgi:hypothetical protein